MDIIRSFYLRNSLVYSFLLDTFLTLTVSEIIEAIMKKKLTKKQVIKQAQKSIDNLKKERAQFQYYVDYTQSKIEMWETAILMLEKIKRKKK